MNDTPKDHKAFADTELLQPKWRNRCLLGHYLWTEIKIASTSKDQFPGTLQGIWYNVLLLVVAYIAPPAPLAVALTQLSSHPTGLSGIRETLGARHNKRIWRPSRLQLIIRQAPIYLLNSSLVFYVVGLGFVLASSLSLVLVKQDVGYCRFNWNNNHNYYFT